MGIALFDGGAPEEALAQFRRVKAEAESAGEPARWKRIEAEIHEAEVLHRLGSHSIAREIEERIQPEILGESDAETRLRFMSCLQGALERCDEDGGALELELLGRSQRRDAGLDTPAELRNSYRREGRYLAAVGRYDESQAVYRKAAEISLAEGGPDSIDHIRDMDAVADGLYRDGRVDEAVALLRECAVKAERWQQQDPYLLEQVLDTLGWVLDKSGTDPIGAEPVLRRAIELNERRVGPAHRSSLILRTNLLSNLVTRKRWEDAERYRDELQSVFERNQAMESDDASWFLIQSAWLHEARGRAEEAYRASAKAVALRENKLGTANARTRLALRQFVPLAWAAGYREESVRRGEELLAAERGDHGWTSPRDLVLCGRLAACHAELGNSGRARELGRELEAGREICYGDRPDR